MYNQRLLDLLSEIKDSLEKAKSLVELPLDEFLRDFGINIRFVI